MNMHNLETFLKSKRYESRGIMFLFIYLLHSECALPWTSNQEFDNKNKLEIEAETTPARKHK